MSPKSASSMRRTADRFGCIGGQAHCRHGRDTLPWSLLLSGCVDLAAIELSPLFGIRQNRIGGGYSFECFFGLWVSGVEVRMMLLS